MTTSIKNTKNNKHPFPYGRRGISIIGWVFLLISLSKTDVWAQELQSNDSIFEENVNEYIRDHKKQLNIKFEVSNDINTFSVQENGNKLTLKPNLNLRYGMVFSYKFLSVRVGFRPRSNSSDKENRGESDTYRLRVKLLFDNWSHFLQYDYDRGFYGENTLSYFPDAGKTKVQFPYLTSNIIFGSSLYKFNTNYSLRSIESQTEIQAKSAGSVIVGLSYNYYKLAGSDRVLYPKGELTYRYPNTDHYGVSFAAIGGYYYTWVFKGNCFLNAFGVPGLGVDLHQSRINDLEGSTTDHNTSLFAAVDYGFGGGYNGRRIFFGANLKNRWSTEKSSQDEVRIQPQKNTFNLYLGYRFKAPKRVLKPVDLIEEKVPILQH